MHACLHIHCLAALFQKLTLKSRFILSHTIYWTLPRAGCHTFLPAPGVTTVTQGEIHCTVLYLRANGLYFPIFFHNFIYLCVKENGDIIVLIGEISEGGNMEMDKWPSKAALNNDS